MLSYSNEGLSRLILIANTLCYRDCPITIKNDRIAISRKDPDGDWRVYAGIIGEKPTDVIPPHEWICKYLLDACIDSDIYWSNYAIIWLGPLERIWLATRIKCNVDEVVEAMWTHQLVNEYALTEIFKPPRRFFGAPLSYIEDDLLRGDRRV